MKMLRWNKNPTISMPMDCCFGISISGAARSVENPIHVERHVATVRDICEWEGLKRTFGRKWDISWSASDRFCSGHISCDRVLRLAVVVVDVRRFPCGTRNQVANSKSSKTPTRTAGWEFFILSWTRGAEYLWQSIRFVTGPINLPLDEWAPKGVWQVSCW